MVNYGTKAMCYDMVVPWFHHVGKPWYAVVCHGIPWCTMVNYGTTAMYYHVVLPW